MATDSWAHTAAVGAPPWRVHIFYKDIRGMGSLMCFDTHAAAMESLEAQCQLYPVKTARVWKSKINQELVSMVLDDSPRD